MDARWPKLDGCKVADLMRGQRTRGDSRRPRPDRRMRTLTQRHIERDIERDNETDANLYQYGTFRWLACAAVCSLTVNSAFLLRAVFLDTTGSRVYLATQRGYATSISARTGLKPYLTKLD
jgi:hypothetical protein